MYITDFETLAAEHRDMVLPTGTEKTRVLTDFYRRVELVGQRTVRAVSYEKYIQRCVRAANQISALIVARPRVETVALSVNPPNTVKISVLNSAEQAFGTLELAIFDRLPQPNTSCQLAAFWESNWSDFNTSSVVQPLPDINGREVYQAKQDHFMHTVIGVEEAINVVNWQVNQRGPGILL